MSIFNASKVKEELFSGGGEPHPEGKFDGKVTQVEVAKTQAGHRVINLIIKTDAGTVRNGINLDHPNCAAISQKTLAQVLDSYLEPPQELSTIEEARDLLVGLPVSIFIKHKGKDDKGYERLGVYFNALPQEAKVKRDPTGAPVRRVEY